MRIEIIGVPLAVCVIDMKDFKAEMKTSLNLKESIKKGFCVKQQHKELKDGELLKYLQYGLDWQNIMYMMPLINKDVMEVRFFNMQYEGKVEYRPEGVTAHARVFQIKEEIKSGTDILMINSFVSSPKADLKAYFDFTTFNYDDKKLKLIRDEV